MAGKVLIWESGFKDGLHSSGDREDRKHPQIFALAVKHYSTVQLSAHPQRSLRLGGKIQFDRHSGSTSNYRRDAENAEDAQRVELRTLATLPFLQHRLNSIPYLRSRIPSFPSFSQQRIIIRLAMTHVRHHS
jgi:hypothetical protein